MTPIYAIGDVHGHAGKLAEALSWIEADGGRDARVVLLGDLVDRGPDSRWVIEILLSGIEDGRDWTVLRGNHDQMFLDFLASDAAHDLEVLDFLDPGNGGPGTLASYGASAESVLHAADGLAAAQAAVPDSHKRFLAGFPLTHMTDRLLCVHAGLRPGVPIPEQDPHDLLWIREPFLSHDGPFERLVVHGHTPVDAPTHYGNRVALDTGAAYGGPLTVGVFEDGAVFTLGPDGRRRLEPLG